MFDDFLVRAMVAGIGLAAVCGAFGCFMIWRRMAYFGDTLSHSALLGVAVGLWFTLNLTIAVFLVGAVIAVLLFCLQYYGGLSADAILGLLSHSALALGLVALATMPGARVDLTGLLFGDILAVSRLDLITIYVGGGLALLGLVVMWRPLLAATISSEVAAAEGLWPERANLIFTLLLALVIAIAMKIIGALLITALLIIPAATARRFAVGPISMVVIAAVCGVISVILGLEGSLYLDSPSGPSIVVACTALFVLSIGIGLIKESWQKVKFISNRGSS